MILAFLTKYRDDRTRVHTGPGGDTSTSYIMMTTTPCGLKTKEKVCCLEIQSALLLGHVLYQTVTGCHYFVHFAHTPNKCPTKASSHGKSEDGTVVALPRQLKYPCIGVLCRPSGYLTNVLKRAKHENLTCCCNSISKNSSSPCEI